MAKLTGYAAWASIGAFCVAVWALAVVGAAALWGAL